MLLFTNGQELAVHAAREGFNAAEEARTAVELVGNSSPIPLDAWRRIDARAAVLQRDILTVFNRLSAANQTPVAVGDIVSLYPKVSDSGEVHISMDGRSEGRADQALVTYEGTPIPIYDSQARFGWRQMEVMRKSAAGLDTVTIANHQRKVAEKLEDVTLNGLASVVHAGSTIYGLRNFPGRNTDVHGFDLNGATGANWLAAVSKVIFKLLGDNAYGKATIFVNYGDWVYAGLNEFVAGYPKTIAARLREVEQVVEFVPASKVPPNELIGISNIGSGEWGSILSAMPMITRPKTRINSEDDYTFSVMAMAAPQFRTDFSGQAPIAHVTKT